MILYKAGILALRIALRSKCASSDACTYIWSGFSEILSIQQGFIWEAYTRKIIDHETENSNCA